MPLISVIIPVYNSISFLEACVQSVLRFTDVDIECILIDDGSTDGSDKLCDLIASKEDRVKVFHQNNSGVSIARNNGIAYAEGEYLFFLDSDDLCLIRDFKFLSSREDLYIGNYAVGVETKYSIIQACMTDISDYPVEYLKGGLKSCIGSFIVRKQIVDANSILYPDNIKYGEDQEFIIKILSASKTISFVPDLICLYRTNLNSAMYKIALDRYDVAISRIRLLEYFRDLDYTTYRYLRYYAIVDALVSVSEELFRHGMPFMQVRNYLKQNSEISSFLQSLDADADRPDNRYRAVFLSCHLFRLQRKVLFGNLIYNLRCKASKLKHRIK